jgi:hypothetical protein
MSAIEISNISFISRAFSRESGKSSRSTPPKQHTKSLDFDRFSPAVSMSLSSTTRLDPLLMKLILLIYAWTRSSSLTVW